MRRDPAKSFVESFAVVRQGASLLRSPPGSVRRYAWRSPGLRFSHSRAPTGAFTGAQSALSVQIPPQERHRVRLGVVLKTADRRKAVPGFKSQPRRCCHEPPAHGGLLRRGGHGVVASAGGEPGTWYPFFVPPLPQRRSSSRAASSRNRSPAVSMYRFVVAYDACPAGSSAASGWYRRRRSW